MAMPACMARAAISTIHKLVKVEKNRTTRMKSHFRLSQLFDPVHRLLQPGFHLFTKHCRTHDGLILKAEVIAKHDNVNIVSDCL